MTVTYTAEVATCHKFGSFIKLLARWKGSIYKLVWIDLLLFLFLYYSINCVYIYLLGSASQKTFESVVYYCASYSSLIPLSFVLGFYVNLVMTRWWEQYLTIPWPDSIAVYVSAHLHGLDEGGRVMRRTVMRYVCLCLTMVFTMISPGVKKRFPKLKHLVDAGLLLENEKTIIDTMDTAFPKYPKHWMPIIWAASIITRARNEGRIRDDFALKTIIDELNNFRGRCGILMFYDFISIPLVYTQVVTIAVYSFFVCSLLAHQWTHFKKESYEALDFYMPIFISLQFLFYMGWLKVAETLINPFGEDDEDFEVNWMIDRNLQVSYLIVDEMHHEHPELVKDQYWDEVYPNELPYEAEAKREQPPEHSTAKYDLDESSVLSATTFSEDNQGRNSNKSTRESIFTIRSDTLTDIFRRFYSSNDENVEQNQVENSNSDEESLHNITSYKPLEKSEESIILKYDNSSNWPKSTLETMIEQEEIEFMSDYEEQELLVEEELENDESQSSYETDSDSDPFERLRIERQQERIKRMNDFLQRYFGSNIRLDLSNSKTGIKKQTYSSRQNLLPTNQEDDLQSVGEKIVSNFTGDSAMESVSFIDTDLRTFIDKLSISEETNKNIIFHNAEVEGGNFVTKLNIEMGDVPGQKFIEKASSLIISNSQSEIVNTMNSNVNILNKKSQNLENPPEDLATTTLNISNHADSSVIDEPAAIASNTQSTPQISLQSTSGKHSIIRSSTLLFSPKLYKRNVATSPMGSIISLTTASSTEPDEWEVVADKHFRTKTPDQ